MHWHHRTENIFYLHNEVTGRNLASTCTNIRFGAIYFDRCNYFFCRAKVMETSRSASSTRRHLNITSHTSWRIFTLSRRHQIFAPWSGMGYVLVVLGLFYHFIHGRQQKRGQTFSRSYTHKKMQNFLEFLSQKFFWVSNRALP